MGTPRDLSGKSLRLEYESGLRVVGHYRSESRLEWEALSGAETGKKGAERIHTAEVAPGVHFVSWLEAGGGFIHHDLEGKRFVTPPSGHMVPDHR